jgi:hypothetical protein
MAKSFNLPCLLSLFVFAHDFFRDWGYAAQLSFRLLFRQRYPNGVFSPLIAGQLYDRLTGGQPIVTPARVSS